jgi:hypothetical protein
MRLAASSKACVMTVRRPPLARWMNLLRRSSRPIGNVIIGARRRDRSNASARGMKTVLPTYNAATTTTAVTTLRSWAVSFDPDFRFIGRPQGMVGQGSPVLPVLRDTRDATALSVMQGNTMAANARKGFQPELLRGN